MGSTLVEPELIHIGWARINVDKKEKRSRCIDKDKIFHTFFSPLFNNHGSLVIHSYRQVFKHIKWKLVRVVTYNKNIILI